MSEENRDQHYSASLVKRYEEMVERNESYYFDTEQFEEIIEHYCSDNKFGDALKVIHYAYTLFPDNVDLLLRESQILAGIGSLGKALSKLRILEKLEPRNEEVYMTMGSIYSQLREHKKAIELFRRALQYCDPGYADEIYMEIALEYENMDRFDKAIEILDDALKRNPDNESLLYELAYCYEVMDRTEESLAYYKAFIDKYPYSFPAWYNVGNACQKLDRLEEAVEAYDYVLAIQDDFVPAYINKAHALFKMGKYREAIQVFEETYSLEQPQAQVFCYVGECFEKLNELDKAVFYYRKSIHADPVYPDAYIGMGVAMGLQGQHSQAVMFLKNAMELDPENVDYKLFYVDGLLHLNKLDEAKEMMEKLAVSHPDNEDVWLDYSNLFYTTGDYATALSVLNEGWSKNPGSTALGYRKVAYLMASGKSAEGEDLMMRMHMLWPEGLDELGTYYAAIKENLLFIELVQQKKKL